MCANHASSALRVLRRRAAPQPDRQARHQRHAALPAEHEARLGRLVDDLVHRAQREVDHAHLDHRPEARERHADRRRRGSSASEIGVSITRAGAELLLQALVLLEDAAAADVLADATTRGSFAHRGLQRERVRPPHSSSTPLAAPACPARRGRRRPNPASGASGGDSQRAPRLRARASGIDLSSLRRCSRACQPLRAQRSAGRPPAPSRLRRRRGSAAASTETWPLNR